MYISSRTTLATKLLSHTHRPTDIFRNSKSWSGHPNACKSIKKRKSKNWIKPILSSIFIEGCKNNYNWKIWTLGGIKKSAQVILALTEVALLFNIIKTVINNEEW